MKNIRQKCKLIDSNQIFYIEEKVLYPNNLKKGVISLHQLIYHYFQNLINLILLLKEFCLKAEE